MNDECAAAVQLTGWLEVVSWSLSTTLATLSLASFAIRSSKIMGGRSKAAGTKGKTKVPEMTVLSAANAAADAASAPKDGAVAAAAAAAAAQLPKEFEESGLRVDAGEGVLSRFTVAQCLARGIDVSDDKYSSTDLFGSRLTGAAYLEQVWKVFGVGEVNVPFFTENTDGTRTRNIIRSPLSRPIQHSTAQSYMQRILREGLSQIVSGG